MNILEIKLEEGNQYEVDFNDKELILTVNEFGELRTEDNYNFLNFVKLRELVKLDFEPYVDWTKVPVDTKVLVRDRCDDEWARRYFHRYNEDNPLKFCTFANGATAWASEIKQPNTCWKYCRLWEGSEEQKAEEENEKF